MKPDIYQSIREALDNTEGYYPQGRTEKNGVFIPRTEWQEGWNAAQTAAMKKRHAAFGWYEAIPEKFKPVVDDLLRADQLSLYVDRQADYKVTISVNCNDLFMWGCADSEDVTLEELPELYDFWRRNNRWGATQWCCVRRKMRPQRPLVDVMKKVGAWTGEMDALMENPYDKLCDSSCSIHHPPEDKENK